VHRAVEAPLRPRWPDRYLHQLTDSTRKGP
jgi:hypothetical protein